MWGSGNHVGTSCHPCILCKDSDYWHRGNKWGPQDEASCTTCTGTLYHKTSQQMVYFPLVHLGSGTKDKLVTCSYVAS